MRTLRTALFSAVCFAAFSLTGCIEYSDSASLRGDGSGQFSMRIGVVADVDSANVRNIQRDAASVPGIAVDSVGAASEEGQGTLVVRVRFDSVGALNALAQKMKLEDLMGVFSLRDSADLRVFSRTLQIRPPSDTAHFDYSLQVPGRVLDADSLAVDQGFSTGFVRWMVPGAGSVPVHLRVVFQPTGASVKLWHIVALAAGLLLLVFVALVCVGRLKRLNWTVQALKDAEENETDLQDHK
jgi:hypothetical protein